MSSFALCACLKLKINVLALERKVQFGQFAWPPRQLENGFSGLKLPGVFFAKTPGVNVLIWSTDNILQ